MRLQNVFTGRPNYYDRTPLAINQTAANGVGPHAFTTRYTYTVPTGRKAWIEAQIAEVDRLTAATTAARVEADVEVVTAGPTTDFLYCMFNNNVVGTLDKIVMGQAGMLIAGGQLIGADEDLSTAGTVNFGETSRATEFDA